jgi:hypothetical protein
MGDGQRGKEMGAPTGDGGQPGDQVREDIVVRVIARRRFAEIADFAVDVRPGRSCAKEFGSLAWRPRCLCWRDERVEAKAFDNVIPDS